VILYNDPIHLLRWGGTTLGLAVAAVGVRLWFEPSGGEIVSGGSRVGLAYGIAGGALIVFAWLLSALRFVPSWWFLGSRAFWLKGHIWLGLLSFVLILCHSGLRFGGLFEAALYGVFFLVVLTGIAGLVLQQFLPRWLTLEVPCEVPYEQIPHMCQRLREKADLDVQAKCTGAAEVTCQRLKGWYGEVMRPYLGWPSNRDLLADAGKTAQLFTELRTLPGVEQSAVADLLDRLESYCTERRRLARQETLHWLLHGWLWLHIPLSAALMVMMIAHAAITLYY